MIENNRCNYKATQMFDDLLFLKKVIFTHNAYPVINSSFFYIRSDLKKRGGKLDN